MGSNQAALYSGCSAGLGEECRQQASETRQTQKSDLGLCNMPPLKSLSPARPSGGTKRCSLLQRTPDTRRECPEHVANGQASAKVSHVLEELEQRDFAICHAESYPACQFRQPSASHIRHISLEVSRIDVLTAIGRCHWQRGLAGGSRVPEFSSQGYWQKPGQQANPFRLILNTLNLLIINPSYIREPIDRGSIHY